jgi:hypothetical protein
MHHNFTATAVMVVLGDLSAVDYPFGSAASHGGATRCMIEMRAPTSYTPE